MAALRLIALCLILLLTQLSHSFKPLLIRKLNLKLYSSSNENTVVSRLFQLLDLLYFIHQS